MEKENALITLLDPTADPGVDEESVSSDVAQTISTVPPSISEDLTESEGGDGNSEPEPTSEPEEEVPFITHMIESIKEGIGDGGWNSANCQIYSCAVNRGC